MCKQMWSNLLKIKVTYKLFTHKSYIYIYIYIWNILIDFFVFSMIFCSVQGYLYVYLYILFFCVAFYLSCLAVVSILLYGCTTWMLTKHMEKRLDGNYTRMLWAILNMSWRQHPTKQQLYSHLPPITKLDEPDISDTAGEVGTNS